MGLLGRLGDLFGGGGGEEYEPDTDDLLDLPAAALTLEERVGFAPTGDAALCFAAADAGGFADALADLDAVLEATEAETGARADFVEDDHGYRWLVLEGGDPDDLATSLQFAAETFADRDFDDQLLAALVAYETDGQRAYLVYSFERGRFYPFVPEGTDDRDTATEFRLQSVLRGELPVEDDRSQWYPLWPDRAGVHPWE